MSAAVQGSEAKRGPVAALGYDEAAAYLSMSRSWLEHSDIPRVKLGRCVRFRIVDLDAHLIANRDRDVA